MFVGCFVIFPPLTHCTPTTRYAGRGLLWAFGVYGYKAESGTRGGLFIQSHHHFITMSLPKTVKTVIVQEVSVRYRVWSYGNPDA